MSEGTWKGFWVFFKHQQSLENGNVIWEPNLTAVSPPHWAPSYIAHLRRQRSLSSSVHRGGLVSHTGRCQTSSLLNVHLLVSLWQYRTAPQLRRSMTPQRCSRGSSWSLRCQWEGRALREATTKKAGEIKKKLFKNQCLQFTWVKLWGLTGVTCAHRIYSLNWQEVHLTTHELRKKGPGFVGDELNFVATDAFRYHNIKLSSFSAIPGQWPHLNKRSDILLIISLGQASGLCRNGEGTS